MNKIKQVVKKYKIPKIKKLKQAVPSPSKIEYKKYKVPKIGIIVIISKVIEIILLNRSIIKYIKQKLTLNFQYK